MKTTPHRDSSAFALTALVLVLLGGGCGKSGSKTGAQPAAAFEARLEAIRQAGEPVTLAEYNAWYVEPPAAQNAAPLYAEAFAALAPLDAKSPSFVAKNQKALELLHQAAARTQCRYPIDLTAGANASLTHLAKLKTCAQLLEQETILNAGNGRMDLAAQSVVAGLRLARSLGMEPVVISQLVRVAIENITASALEQALNRKAFSEPELAKLQSTFGEAESGDAAALARCLAGERCMGIAMFQSSLQELAKISGAMGQEARFPDLEIYRKSPAYSADFAFYLDQMNSFINAAKSPFPDSLEAASLWLSQVSEAKNKGYVISGVMLPALAKTLEKSAAAVGELRAAQAALAVERHRSAHNNELPDSLRELVPQYLTAVPADPFDGKPLRYKKASPKGYVIYSIGADRQDDGGTPKPAGA